MYVRIARFEGGDPSAIDSVVSDVKQDIESNRETVAGGGRPEGWSDTRLEGTKAIRRVLMLVDRQTGNGAGVVFCDSEEDLRKADAMLNELSPQGPARRTGVEMYEVALDEKMR
jgi:hypothetical protein